MPDDPNALATYFLSTVVRVYNHCSTWISNTDPMTPEHIQAFIEDLNRFSNDASAAMERLVRSLDVPSDQLPVYIKAYFINRFESGVPDDVLGAVQAAKTVGRDIVTSWLTTVVPLHGGSAVPLQGTDLHSMGSTKYYNSFTGRMENEYHITQDDRASMVTAVRNLMAHLEPYSTALPEG